MTVQAAPLSAAPAATALRDDPQVWDAFVAASAAGVHTQLTPWAEVKAANGWRAVRVAADAGAGPIGAQVLVRRIGPGPFAVGYAPRGPVARSFDEASVAAFTAEMRSVASREHLTHVTVDPALDDEGHARRFTQAGWRPGQDVQHERTLVIDLSLPEAELWSGLRSRWRSYVNKASRSGVRVVEGDATDLDEFYGILVETGRRAGFPYRTAASYRLVYETFAARQAARLLFARLPDGRAVATMMLVGCGGRISEPYAGMTDDGGETRANYLLHWEAIRQSREAGYSTYDMWGLAHPGIEHFKTGFGGREVRYIGAWDLVAAPLLRAGFTAARRLWVALPRGKRSSADGGRSEAA